MINATETIVSTEKDVAISCSEYGFSTYSATYSKYESTSVVDPDPVFSGDAFSGGSVTGWFVVEVSIDDYNPTLAFGQDYNGSGGIWFSLVK